MSFFGSLGIDPQLLIAQLINFGLLLWILKRFLYAPIIARIEKDEAELSRAQMLNEELQSEKAEFAKKKRLELRRARDESERLIEDATAVAKGIESKAHADALTELDRAVASAQAEAEAEKSSLIRGYEETAQKASAERLIRGMKEGMPAAARREIQNVFFQQLIKSVEALPLATVQESAPRVFREILGVAKRRTGPRGGAGTATTQKLREMVEQKMGPVVLEYGIPPTEAQIKTLWESLSEKFGFPFPIPVKTVKNERLLAGFRLEVWGVLLEHHLAQELTYGLANE